MSMRWARIGLVFSMAVAIAIPAFAVSSDTSQQSQGEYRFDPDRIKRWQERKAARAAARAERWPKPVEEFLAGEFLERADVVLTTRKGDLTSSIIRWATASPFSHAAMVFTGPQFETGYSSTFVIEAGSGGVDLTNIRDYINDKSSFIAVKRFKRTWFDEPKQARVRGILLDRIKGSYNYWAIGRIARNLWFGVQRQVQGKEKAIESYRKNEWQPPNDYICSGLVQLGFVEAAIEFIKAGQMPASALKDVVFNEVAASRLPDAPDWEYMDPQMQLDTAELFREQNIVELEAVTPQDLATSGKLEWLYLIQDGQVYKVSSYDDVVNKLK